MKFKLKTAVQSAEVAEEGVALTHAPAKGGDATTDHFDVVLVATGRRPFTEGLGLENLGIETDKLGRVQVDEHFRTKVPSVFAFGDVIDGPMLAHKAEEEGIACVENIAGFAGHVNYDAIPGVIYTHPELATVGRTEEQLKEANIEYKVGSFPFSANSRARRRRFRGHGQGPHGRGLGQDPRRAHHRPERRRDDRRGRPGHGVRRLVRGRRADVPRAPDPQRGHEGGVHGRLVAADPLLDICIT